MHQSTNRAFGAKSGALTFNAAQYAGVELQVHGGDPQRGATRNSKPSFRLKFAKADPFAAKHAVPFNFPKSNRCNNLRKLVLRGEWNDHPLANNGIMIRNKLSQDILKHAGAQTPREDFAELSVNGNYFGLYGLEEYVGKEWFECNGWNPDASSLYKANAMGSAATSWHPNGDAASPGYAEGYERKIPDCDNCDNGDGKGGCQAQQGEGLQWCDEDSWPDKDHCLVCGDCKVLVDQMQSRYGGKCDNYCAALGKECVAAWEEVDDTVRAVPGRLSAISVFL